MTPIDLLSYNIAELTACIQGLGLPAFRARQIFQWLQQKGVPDFAAMTNLPLELRQRLQQDLPFQPPRIIERQEAAAGDTVKLLLELADGQRIETVAMLYARAASRDRATCCVSSQSGCRMGCAFCATGQFRKARNLTAGEMVAQVLLSAACVREKGFDGITNVVYMGMGEPLLNLAAVKKSILLLNDALGQNIGQRRITLSTCGLVPQIYEVADWGLQIGLAISLHSADEEKRRRLMPVAGEYALADLRAACEYFRSRTGRRVTFEYALFAGVNDSPADAALLADFLTDTDILVNIIPANPVEAAGFLPSGREIIEIFCAKLQQRGVSVALREARGVDIDAACGQLRSRQDG